MSDKKTTHHERRIQAVVNDARGVQTPQEVAQHRDRLHLVQHNTEGIAGAAKGWIGNGHSIADAVVFVVDLDDPEGERFAAVVDPEYKKGIPKDLVGVPTLCIAVERSFAAMGLGTVAPPIGQQLASPPAKGRVWVVCIASGGTTLFDWGLDANAP